MEINIVRIYPETQIKIYEKHGVTAQEIESILKDSRTIFRKVGGNQLTAIGLDNRYITVFFRYNSERKQATVTTAYESTQRQIRHYRHYAP